MSKDRIPTVADARKLITTNGHSLNGREKLIDISEFMNMFKGNGYKAMAESILSTIDKAMQGKVDMKQAKIQFDGYKMLIELKVLDERAKREQPR